MGRNFPRFGGGEGERGTRQLAKRNVSDSDTTMFGDRDASREELAVRASFIPNHVGYLIIIP